MLVKAYAKINLSLDVVGKREDGYHLLKMIMQNIELYDLLNVKKIDSGIIISCNKKFVPTDERNIAYKAAKLFKETYCISAGVSIEIRKNIPVAAGLAGGSTDAAAVLKAMRDLYRIDISDKELMGLGLKLGADVPYCIHGGSAICEGIGEVITPLKSFKQHIIVLVKPSFGVSTKEVYINLDINKIKKHPNTELLLEAIESENLELLSGNMKNVLENVTLKKHKAIRQLKENMIHHGALGSLMSGSGPSVFGIFDDILKAQRCFEDLKTSCEEVFITRTI
ncbi:MAG: 4-(cytidine 5'-diphospho)-2-C-methyl-D-erythritol kinase [Clostridiaceae bacterium]|nr:4-(cytidine 5'-diphospho)-2-C-methyl-D-erythritol kinase [Clostridiaceae bacterium]